MSKCKSCGNEFSEQEFKAGYRYCEHCSKSCRICGNKFNDDKSFEECISCRYDIVKKSTRNAKIVGEKEMEFIQNHFNEHIKSKMSLFELTSCIYVTQICLNHFRETLREKNEQGFDKAWNELLPQLFEIECETELEEDK